jgi:hypothetical protein
MADISNIKWDENAFESLVLLSNYKQLILSFMEGQLHYKDDFDDVIKGKGLISNILYTRFYAKRSADFLRTRNYNLVNWCSKCWKDIDC